MSLSLELTYVKVHYLKWSRPLSLDRNGTEAGTSLLSCTRSFYHSSVGSSGEVAALWLLNVH